MEFGAEDGGRTQITLRVELPDAAFRRLPGSLEGLTVEVSPTFTNDRGVTGAARIVSRRGLPVRQGEARGPRVWPTTSARACSTDRSRWASRAPSRASPSRRSPARSASGRRQLGCGLRTLGLQASNLNRHVGYGVFVQRLGGAFECGGGAPCVSPPTAACRSGRGSRSALRGRGDLAGRHDHADDPHQCRPDLAGDHGHEQDRRHPRDGADGQVHDAGAARDQRLDRSHRRRLRRSPGAAQQLRARPTPSTSRRSAR